MRLPGILSIVLLCTALPIRANDPTDMADGPWLADPMGIITKDIDGADLPEGFILSDPHTVEPVIKGRMSCYKLHIGGRYVASITNAMRAGDGLVFEECRYFRCKAEQWCWYRNNGKECMHGSVRGWFVATGADLVPRQLEGLGYFSNPVPCGSRLAYWSHRDTPEHETDSEYYAYVANIRSGKILGKVLVGQAWIGTDNAYHLPIPKWRPDCSEVLFSHPRYLRPKLLTLSALGE